MRIQQIRNATVLLTYGGRKFLINPMFAPKDSYKPIKNSSNPDLKWPMCELPMPAEKLAKEPDAIIITNYNKEHFDEFAIDILRKGKKVFIQNNTDKEILRNHGFSNLEVLSTEGSSFVLTRLYKTGCQYTDKSKTKKIFKSMGISPESMGIIFQHEEEKTLYYAGDTCFCQEVKNAINKYKPDYIIINGANIQLSGNIYVTMRNEDIKHLHEYTPNSKIIINHMDCSPYATVNRQDLKKYIKDNKLNEYIIIPNDGDYIEIN